MQQGVTLYTICTTIFCAKLCFGKNILWQLKNKIHKYGGGYFSFSSQKHTNSEWVFWVLKNSHFQTLMALPAFNRNSRLQQDYLKQSNGGHPARPTLLFFCTEHFQVSGPSRFVRLEGHSTLFIVNAYLEGNTCWNKSH